MKKKLLVMVIAALMALALIPTTVFAEGGLFSDVTDQTAYWYEPVNWAATNEITKGYADGTFGAEKACTRRELMIFLWRQMGKQEGTVDPSERFNDWNSQKYPETSDTYKAVSWGITAEITKGFPDGSFGADSEVTRKDAIIMIYRAAGKPEWTATRGEMTFTDVAGIYGTDTDTYNAICWAYNNRITNGYSTGAYKGQFGCTLPCLRKDIVTFLYRLNTLKPSNPVKVKVPTAATNLVYTGEEQTGVALPEGAKYTLSGNAATDAGDYVATAALTDKDSYVWDLTTPTADNQTIAWSIAKATPAITGLTCSNVAYGTAPSPSAQTTFGTITYSYSDSETGNYGPWETTNQVGIYYVKAIVAEGNNWKAAESDPVSFEVTVPVTGISLKFDLISLYAGSTETLNPTIAPLNASNKNVTWSSSDENVATVSDSGVVTGIGAGTADITVTTQDGGFTDTCSVTVKSKITVPTAATNLVYTGSEQTGVALPEGAKYTLSDNAATNAGTYVATAVLKNKDNYVWDLATPTADNQTINWSIAKATLTKDDLTFNAPTNLVYDGNAKAASFTNSKTHFAAITIKYAKSVNAEDWSDVPPKNAGTYYVKAYIAEDANHNAVNLTDSAWTFTIAKAKVDVPTAKTGLVYNGTEQIGVALPEGAKYTLSVNAATDAGNYTATAALKDEDNYVWNLTTPTADSQTINWSIAKATLTKDDLTFNAPTSLVYDGNAKSASFTNSKTHFAAITIKYATSVNAEEWSTVPPKNAGTYYAKAVIAEDANHNAVNLTDSAWTFTIAKAKVDVPTAETGLSYNGTEQIGVALPAGAKYTLSVNAATAAGNYTATAALTDKDNYVWLKTTTSNDQSINWSIAKADNAMTFDMGKTSTETTQSDADEKVSITAAKNVPEDAATYKVYIQGQTIPTDLFAVETNTTGTFLVCKANTPANTYDLVVTATSGGKNYKELTLPEKPKTTTAKNFTWTVKQKVGVTGISLNKTSASIRFGSTETLTAMFEPDNASNKNVTWSSNDEAVAYVSDSGLVTGISEGTAVITVTTQDGGFTATCTVTVERDN